MENTNLKDLNRQMALQFKKRLPQIEQKINDLLSTPEFRPFRLSKRQFTNYVKDDLAFIKEIKFDNEMREIEINASLQKNKCRHVIGFKGFFVVSSISSISSNEFKTFLVFERVHCFSKFSEKMWDALKQNYKRCLLVFYQMVLGVEEIHSNEVIHRDLKPQNMGIKLDGVLKIFDFGSAFIKGVRESYLKNPEENGHLKASPFNKNPTTQTGTDGFLSPEMILEEKVSYSTDVWSLGIMMYFIYYGRMPMDTSIENKGRFLDNLEMNLGKYRQEPVKSQGERIVKKLILSCLRINPEERKTASELKQFLDFEYLMKHGITQDKVFERTRNTVGKYSKE